MNNHILLALLFSLNLVNVHASNSGLQSSVSDSMRTLDPASILPGFTETPKEVGMRPLENEDSLKGLGNARIKEESNAREIYEKAAQSHSVTPNPDSPELTVGKEVIENASAPPTTTACGAGECDNTQIEVSDDINEGIVRLGSVSESANEVRVNQIPSGVPGIFRGDVVDCKKYALGIRDCCTDSGWGSWVVHCPAHLQALQKAKSENRVVYLGKYRKHKLDIDLHHTFCVFPTRLAGLLQMQGRANQLHISFGTPKNPICRGITPEELARINFKAIDLSSLTADYKNRMVIPASTSQRDLNQSHAEQLEKEGRAHD